MGLYLHEREEEYPRPHSLLGSGFPHEHVEDEHISGETGGQRAITRRPNANASYLDFVALMRFDFTRDIVILIEVKDATGADRYEHVPLRNKVDPGTTENFINADILARYNMDPARIMDIPLDGQKERTLEQIDGNFVPKQEVSLLWHLLQDSRQRQSKFIIVENVGFDVLIGAKQFAAEAPTAMWAWPSRQTRGL